MGTVHVETPDGSTETHESILYVKVLADGSLALKGYKSYNNEMYNPAAWEDYETEGGDWQ